ncbi:MAG: glycosyltransferase [Clostridiales bacterium]|nr:glycosyltransferase [Clostridiales bacterium]
MKKVLFVAYQFPPMGGSGVQRSMKFVKYLPDFDWTPVVLTRKVGQMALMDDSMLKELPADTCIFRTPSWDLTELPSVLSLAGKVVARKILIPDGERLWQFACFNEAKKIIKQNSISLIYTTSYPYSSHLLGLALKKHFQHIPWVADFRDEWTNNPYLIDNPRNFIRTSIERRMEKKVLTGADRLIANTPVMMENFIKLYEDAGYESKGKFSCIPNGFDDEDFVGLVAVEKADPDYKKSEHTGAVENTKAYENDRYAENSENCGNAINAINAINAGNIGYAEITGNTKDIGSAANRPFTITYTGAFYGRRQPDVFFSAVSSLIKQGLIPESMIKIKLIGNFKTEKLKAQISKYGLDSVVELLSYMPHRQCLKELIDSDALALIEGKGPGGGAFYTGKIFEYMNTGRPVLGIIPKPGAAAGLLEDTGTGLASDAGDEAGAAANLLALYKSFRDGLPLLKPDLYKIRRFERRSLTRELAELFDNMIAYQKAGL